jgi:hypothetical protein
MLIINLTHVAYLFNNEKNITTSWHSLSYFLVHKNKKKHNDKHWLIIVFSGCKETKEKKTTMSVGLSPFFLDAQKEKKKKR